VFDVVHGFKFQVSGCGFKLRLKDVSTALDMTRFN